MCEGSGPEPVGNKFQHDPLGRVRAARGGVAAEAVTGVKFRFWFRLCVHGFKVESLVRGVIDLRIPDCALQRLGSRVACHEGR